MAIALTTNWKGGVGVPAAVAALMAAESALNAIKVGIRLVEDDPKFKVMSFEL